MDTVDNVLLSFIFSHFSRGTVFFAEDLEPSGVQPEAIRFSLSRLVVGEWGIVRLGRGIYCNPEMSGRGGKLLMPSMESLAGSIARRWKVRIAPCGAQAAYLAGFTGLQVYPYTWVSDGSDQVFHLQNGKSIHFVRRKSLKVFQFLSPVMRNLCEGLRFVGKDAVGIEERGVVADNLLKVSDAEFQHDIRLCPQWIRELLAEIRG